MATTPTQNSVPSESPIDLKFNAGKIDEFVTSFSQWYVDRFGVQHYTIEGLKQLALQQIYNLGWNLVGSFQDGATLDAAGDIIQDETTGVWYRWDDLQTLPKTVPENSTPDSTGGIGEGKWLAVDVSDVLRKDLEESNGSTLIGGSVYVVDYFSDAKAANAGNSKYIMTRGHHVFGVGAATYFSDGTTGVPSTGNELKFFDVTGKGWYLRHDGRIDCRQFGVVADGSDETTKLQLWLDCCAAVKAEAYIPKTISPSAASLRCVSPNHDGLKFNWEGYVRHFGDGTKAGVVVDSWDPTSGYVLYLKGVNDISGLISIDGARTSKIDDSHIHNVHSYGGNNHRIGWRFKETRGDGIYLNNLQGNSNPSGGPTPPTNLNYPFIESINSAFDGRNAISIIAVDGLRIGNVYSWKHGGVVEGQSMPSGVDIEPNYYYQKVYNVHIDNVVAYSAGTQGGLSIIGKQNGTDTGDFNVRNVYVGSASLRFNQATTGFTHRCLMVSGAMNVNIAKAHMEADANYTANEPIALSVGAVYGCNINFTSRRFKLGAALLNKSNFC